MIDIGSNDCRDPEVCHYGIGGADKWIMLIASGGGRKIAIYESTHLPDRATLGEFGPTNATDGVWELRDLFPLPVDGDSANTKRVMLVSVGGGPPNGGAAGGAHINVDHIRFSPLAPDTTGETPWPDSGADR